IATALAIQGDGKIVVVGDDFRGLLPERDFGVARLNRNGSPDSSFAGDGTESIGFGDDDFPNAVAIDYNGTPKTNPYYGTILVAGGSFIDDVGAFAVARFKSNGDLDTRFDHDGTRRLTFPRRNTAVATGVVAQPGGKVVVSGTIAPGKNTPVGGEFAVARFNAAGRLDFSFGPVR